MSENWFKVCLHAHTTESDGDEPLDSVIDWYRRLGFDCLVVTDHNLVTLPGGEPPQGPLLIGGEEVTVMLEGETVAVYVNGVGLREAVEPIVRGRRARHAAGERRRRGTGRGHCVPDLPLLQGRGSTTTLWSKSRVPR